MCCAQHQHLFSRRSHVPQLPTTCLLPLKVLGTGCDRCPSLLPGVSHADARQPGKSPSFSVNWVVGNTDLEVINATTGKRTCGSPSRLCKHMFFTRWAKLHGKVGLMHWQGAISLACKCWTFTPLLAVRHFSDFVFFHIVSKPHCWFSTVKTWAGQRRLFI